MESFVFLVLIVHFCVFQVVCELILLEFLQGLQILELVSVPFDGFYVDFLVVIVLPRALRFSVVVNLERPSRTQESRVGLRVILV